MLLFELVKYIDENGIGIKLVDGRLSITGDEALLTDDVVAAIRTYKREIGAHYVDRDSRETIPVTDGNALPLSYAQRRLYFLYQYDPEVTHFILPVELELKGALDVAAFRCAVESVVDRHKIYKTTYFVDAGVPCQRFEADRRFEVEYLDSSELPEDQQQSLLVSKRIEVAGRAFDLEHELPLRACLIKHGHERYSLLISFHHIATDEWSIQQFVGEIAAHYRDHHSGTQALPSPPAISYLDYAAWQVERFEGGGYEVSRSYWKRHLQGIKGVLELPLDAPRPAMQTYNGDHVEVSMPDGLHAKVSAFVRENRIPEFSFCLAIYYLLLNKLTHERDIVVGTDVFGREHADLKDMAGFFVNQLALRSQLQPEASVSDYLRQVNASALASLGHQDMPFDKVVDDLAIERDAAYPPVFQVKFLYERSASAFDWFEGVELLDRSAFATKAQYDLTLKVVADTAIAYFNTDLLGEATVRSWLETYFALMAEVVERPETAIEDLLQDRVADQLQPLTHGDRVEVEVGSLFGRVDRAVAASPNAIAVRAHDGHVTYAELKDQLTRIAARLTALGIRKGDKVGVYLERSPDMVAAILATMRVGGVLVPLDTSYPSEHIEYTLSDSGAPVVITNAWLAQGMPEYFGFTLDVEAIHADSLPVAPLDYPDLAEGDLAYLLYTSGSTGRPKGALITHAAFANLCDWYIRFCGLDSASHVLLMIPIGFDASIKNIFAPLMVGGTLVLARPDQFDPETLLRQIEETGVSVINCAPSAIYALLKHDERAGFAALRSLEMLALGGEALDQAQLAAWLRSDACRAAVANIYGPTECTDISVAFKASKDDWLQRDHVAIGKPIQNVQAFIVDSAMRRCLRGVAGELVVAGIGVGNGYQNLPEVTARSFVKTQLSGRPVYRSGDYCKYDRDGNIVYLGRRDGQIKIRGKRVEVDEIVHQLSKILPARAISVQLYSDAGSELLLAFVDGGAASMTSKHIKALLASQLPRHMVPAQFIFVDTLPLTPNGKVCSKSLVCLFESQRSTVEVASSSFNETEQLIASVWEKLLHVKVVGKDADFFSLGGDSIFSIQVVAELRSLGIEVSVADLFKHPNLESLADFIAQDSGRLSTAEAARSVAPFALVPDSDRKLLPAGIEDAYPVTPLQAGMLFHGLLDAQGSTYHDVFSFELSFEFDEAVFRRAIERVVALHPVLRTGFDFGSYSIPLQIVHPEVVPSIFVRDISTSGAVEQEEFIAERIRQIKADRFKLEGPSLIRYSILKLAEHRIQCIVDAHHAILDGWSMATVQRQIFEYYRHFKNGTELADVFDSGGLRFADYVAQVTVDESDRASQEFWNRYCRMPGSHDVLDVRPGEYPFESRSFQLEPELVGRLEKRAAQEGVALKSLMLMAHACMLQALTGRSRLLTGVTDNGRLEAHGAQNMVGLFLNVLPLDIDLQNRTWSELGKAIRQAEVESKPYRRHSFASIVRRNPQLKVETNFTFTNFRVANQLTKEDWLQVKSGEMFEEVDFKVSTHVGGNAADGLTVTLNSKINLSPSYFDVLQRAFLSALDGMADNYERAIPQPAWHWLPAFGMRDDSSATDRRVTLIRYKGRLDGLALMDAAAQLTHRVACLDGSVAPALAGMQSLCCSQLEPAPADGEALRIDAALRRLEASEGAFKAVCYEFDGWQCLALSVSPIFPAGARRASLICDLVERYSTLSGVVDGLEVKTGKGSGWHDVRELERCAAFWREHLTDAPVLLELPTDRPRPAVPTDAGSSVPVVLSANLTLGLRALSQRHGGTLFTTLLAGWSALLSRLSNQQDVVIGGPMANGSFADTLALRIGLDGLPTVAQLLAQVKATVLGAYEHQDLPFEQVVEVLQPPRSLSHRPIFQAALDWNDGLSRGELAPFETRPETSPLDLSLSLSEVGDTLLGRLNYASDLFDASTVARWVGHLQTLLEAMVTDDQQRVSALPLLCATEREQVLVGFNDTAMAFGPDRLIHELFEAQAARQPDADALIYEGEVLSYSELNRRANQVAHHLIELGVKPDDRVAICVDRSVAMVVGLLGVLKAGGAYVPLDPGYPTGRLAYMLTDSAPTALLTQSALRAGVPMLDSLAIPVLVLDDDSLSVQPVHNPDAIAIGLESRHLAYVIYTSGSTGHPKGVAIEHRNVINLWAALEREVFAICDRDARVGLNAGMSFDASVQSLTQLLTGRCIVIVPATVRASGEAMVTFLAQQRIEAFDCTPAQFELMIAQGLLDAAEPRPRAILIGGEALSVRAWEAAAGSAIRCFNVYGPTECTVDATLTRVAPGAGPHIGRPLANTRVYILDAERQPVPLGVAGELYIGGAGVARAYWNRPELTAERFVSDPLGEDSNARLYRTGDLGRWRADGNIEYLGRNDFQVKIRGFRIEPGEIEAQLSACEGVREAVVIAREDSPGDKRLVAYLVPHAGVALSIAALRESLSGGLAEHMIPSAFVSLDALPLTLNGKLDRRALPMPGQLAVASREYEAPVGEVEQAIATIWQALLGLERVGRHDHFFELGGHSLLVMRLATRIREQFQVDVPLSGVFERPVLSALADSIRTLQLEVFLGDELGGMQDELDSLTEAELVEILKRESVHE